jgi:flagella basal body P-ring formation protein FlgA
LNKLNIAAAGLAVWAFAATLHAEPARQLAPETGVGKSGSKLAELAQQALDTRLSAACKRVRLQTRDDAAAAMLPSAALHMAARVPAVPRLARRMVVWVDVFEGALLYRSVPLWFDVACYRTVLQASRPIARGTALNAENTREAEADIAAIAGLPLQAAQDVMAREDLAAGQIIDERAVLPLPLVRKEAPVRVYVSSGAVRLELPAVALSDGALGAQVLVRVPGRSEAIKAKVIGSGELEVL